MLERRGHEKHNVVQRAFHGIHGRYSSFCNVLSVVGWTAIGDRGIFVPGAEFVNLKDPILAMSSSLFEA
jgi:hypothetical protein